MPRFTHAPRLDLKNQAKVMDMTMDTFYTKYFAADPHVSPAFLELTLDRRSRIGDIAVRFFIEVIHTHGLIRSRTGCGKKTVNKIQAKLAEFGIEWK